MGTTKKLKEFNPKIQGFAMEPKEELHGLEGLKHMASSIVPGIYNEEFLDGKISIQTEEAYDMVKTLEKEEGILVGQSSAAALCGALELARRVKKGVIVTIFPDSCLLASATHELPGPTILLHFSIYARLPIACAPPQFKIDDIPIIA